VAESERRKLLDKARFSITSGETVDDQDDAATGLFRVSDQFGGRVDCVWGD
jgi:hypothetical protein